ncbi:MAG: DUF4254 domain-containing protein [Gammaproteobacteria bacterium]
MAFYVAFNRPRSTCGGCCRCNSARPKSGTKLRSRYPRPGCSRWYHRCNFELWHEDDKARRDDRGYEYVYGAKRRIDRWDQRRNDVVERIDEWIAARYRPVNRHENSRHPF